MNKVSSKLKGGISVFATIIVVVVILAILLAVSSNFFYFFEHGLLAIRFIIRDMKASPLQRTPS